MRKYSTTAQAAVGFRKDSGLGLRFLLLSLLFIIHGPVTSQHQQPVYTGFCSVSPYPEPRDLIQPNGDTIKVQIFNVNHAYYLETLDGFTILKDPGDHYYKYVVGSSDGDLFLSNITVHPSSKKTASEKMITNQISRHLRYSGKALAAKRAGFEQAQLNAQAAPPGVFPSTGIRRAVLLLIRYPDQAHTYTQPAFVNLVNQEGYNTNGQTGSFRDYYQDISYGTLTVNTDVSGWHIASNNRSTYGYGVSPGDFTKAIPLVREAIDAAEAGGVDFNSYDGDGDGKVDVVMVIHSGRGAEESADGDDIWSHRWTLSAAGKQVTYDGKLINDYIIQPEKLGTTNISNIGVLCHEFGHALGLPDLYDTDDSSAGLGRWCLMAGGIWNNGGKTPAHMSAWCKAELGWISYNVLSNNGAITNMDYIDHGPVGYRMNTPVATEYFLIENRQKIGWDAALPSSGLAIYHVDETRSGNTNEARYLVNLEQADGFLQLNSDDNSGDAGDLFPGSTNNITFSCNSNPNSHTYDNQTSNKKISAIEKNGNLISFNYGLCQSCAGTPNPGNIVSTDNSPCQNQNFTLSLSNTSSEAGLFYQWQMSSNNNSWSNISGAVENEYTVAISSDIWFRCKVTCTSSSQSAYSTSTLISNGSSNCYCSASAGSQEYEKIGLINFKGINNASQSPAGYEDFMTLNTGVVQGEVFSFTAQITNPFDQDQIIVWIDYNQNGSFLDNGEKVFFSDVGIGPHSGNIQIPANALVGTTRLRVRLHDSGLGPNDTPCGVSQYGQVEDYTLIIGSSECENEMMLLSPSHDISSGSHKFEVNMNLTASNKITQGSVIFDAGLSILLQPDFSIGQGAELILQIDGCGNQ